MIQTYRGNFDAQMDVSSIQHPLTWFQFAEWLLSTWIFLTTLEIISCHMGPSFVLKGQYFPDNLKKTKKYYMGKFSSTLIGSKFDLAVDYRSGAKIMHAYVNVLPSYSRRPRIKINQFGWRSRSQLGSFKWALSQIWMSVYYKNFRRYVQMNI